MKDHHLRAIVWGSMFMFILAFWSTVGILGMVL